MTRNLRSILKRVPRIRLGVPVRTLDRYVARTFLFSYVICAVSFLGLYVVIEAFSRLERFWENDLPILVVVFRYFAVQTPVVYTHYLGPLLTLTAGMFTFAFLNRTNELTPMKASGVSIYRAGVPIFAGAVVFGIVTVCLQEFVLPGMKDEIREGAVLGKRKPYVSRPVFDDAFGNSITMAKYYPAEKEGFGVQVFKEGKEETWIVRATHMVYREGRWVLPRATIQRKKGTFTTDYKKEVAEYTIETDMIPEDLESSEEDIPYLSFKDLRHQHRRHPHHHHLEVKIHHRFAFPLSHVILLLLGLPLVLIPSNRHVFITLAVCIVICGAYFIVSYISIELGNRGQIPPMVAAWLPTMFFGALGLTMFENIRT